MGRSRSSDARETIKTVARRLFIEHGLEAVSVRDILEASGQKNGGAIGYYFETKEGLVREILIDGAKAVDQRRGRLLDELEASGTEITIREIMWILVRSSLEPDYHAGDRAFIRYFAMFQLHNQALWVQAIVNQHDHGYRRCIKHIRRLVPDLPRQTVNHRVIFMMLALGSSLALYESWREAGERASATEHYGGAMWASRRVLDDLVDGFEGLLVAPVHDKKETAPHTRSKPRRFPR